MDFLIYLALVPTLAFVAQWLAWRTRLPGILLLLAFGMALGQFVRPDDLLAELSGSTDPDVGPRILFPIVSLAVAVIMFEGGLTLKLSELSEAGSAALRLCTLGAAITLVAAAIAAHFILGFDWRVSCLLGAILVVTGPTVIGPLLQQVQPSSRVSNTLKWEGIVIDPIGAVLAVLVFEVLLLHPSDAFVWNATLLLGKTILIGGIAGVLAGWSLSQAMKRYLIPDYLHGVGALGLALLVFALSNHFAHESGLIAVTIFGLWMTNQDNLDIEHIVEFKENLRTLLIGCLFVLLASLVDLPSLAGVALKGTIFVAILILIVRPLSVFVSLLGSPLNYREQAFVAGLAPRGIVAAAVSSVFALRIEQSDQIQSFGAGQLDVVTFLVIAITVAFYGLLANPFARFLRLSSPNKNGVLILGADPWVIAFASQLKRAGCRVILIDTNFRKITNAKLAHLEGICGDVMNEHLREDLDLSSIGHFLAMTPNDHVNALAVRECRSTFGRSKTYQLPFKTDNRREMTSNMMGRALFGEQFTHSKVTSLVADGMEFKTTKVSDEFSFEDFESRYPENQVLATLAEDGQLTISTKDEPSEPKAGQSLIALVRTPEADEPDGSQAV